jgi:sugar phosphate isomerase/epimerase
LTYWTTQVDFGVVHSLVFPECRDGSGPMLETLEVIAADETFGAVEIAPVPDPELRSRVRTLLQSASLQVVYLPILPIIFGDLAIGGEEPNARRHAVDTLKGLLSDAAEFDAPLAMVTGPRDPGPDNREATFIRLAEDLAELCDHADAVSGDQRLHITFENFDRDVEKKRLVGPTSEAIELVDAVNREHFGLTIDLSHLPLLGETPSETLGAVGHRLIHAHIGNCIVDYPDCPYFGDFHPRFGHPLGRNDVEDVVAFLEALNRIDYWDAARRRLNTTPILSMEIKPTPDDAESPGVVLANGKRAFTRAWAQVNGRPEA